MKLVDGRISLWSPLLSVLKYSKQKEKDGKGGPSAVDCIIHNKF
jgi:hypothetical protein